MFRKKYRIVTDNFRGYEVQERHTLFHFWIETNVVNTFGSIEEAKNFIEAEKVRTPKKRFVSQIVWEEE